jgi:hypothetical protein
MPFRNSFLVWSLAKRRTAGLKSGDELIEALKLLLLKVQRRSSVQKSPLTKASASRYAEGSCKYLRMLASQSIPTWNQIISWLKEMETLRIIAA